MSSDRDSALAALFAKAERCLEDAEFTSAVMARIDSRRRRITVGRLAFVAALVAFEFLFSAPLQSSVGAFSEALAATLIETDNEWLAFAFAPLNSVAGLIGALLVGLHFLFRRMSR